MGKYGSRTIDLVCVSETLGKLGEVDEMVRDNFCFWSVSGAAKNET